MTDHCLDTDSLVSVASALEWAVPARLDHLAACERCRARLTELARLQKELAAAPPLPDLDPAMAIARAGAGPAPIPAVPTRRAVRAPAPGDTPGPRAVAALVAAATFLVAGATTLLVVTLLAASPSAPLALTVAALAGLASIAPAWPFRPREA